MMLRLTFVVKALSVEISQSKVPAVLRSLFGVFIHSVVVNELFCRKIFQLFSRMSE